MTILQSSFQMADAFEIIILSILADQLHCDWSLSLPKKALITTVVFVGYLIGASTFGSWSDKYGRKNVSTNFPSRILMGVIYCT